MLSIENLHYRYPGAMKLIDGMNLNLESGHIYGLLGRNGTGKTTLIKIIHGLLFPKKGSVHFRDMNVSERATSFLQQLFYLPEEFDYPDFTFNQFANVYGAFYPDFDQAKFYRNLSEFELPVQSKIRKMSYGQKKKVLLSFAVASNASFLLLDEPTNGLDIPSKAIFRKILSTELDENTTVLISTHQVKDLTNLIDHVLIMDSGEIIFNQDYTNISKKLLFETGVAPQEGEDYLYSEAIIGGYITVKANPDEDFESEIDMEALFNTVIKEKELINELFN